MAQNLITLMSMAALNHTHWVQRLVCPSKGKLFMTPSILSLFQLDMSYCTYWLGQGTGCFHFHWLPGHLSAASHWLPGGEWEGSSPHPPPVAERVNVKTLFLPIIWVTRGFGVCLRARVSACVCMLEGESDKEREKGRERQAAFLLPPVSLLPVTPSFLPSPGPPSSPASSRTETPYHPDHPGTLWLSSLLRPTNHSLWEGKTAYFSSLWGFKKYLLPFSCSLTQNTSKTATVCFYFLYTQLSLFSLASLTSLYAYFKFPLQHFCSSHKSDTVAGDDISEVTVFFFFFLWYSAVISTYPSLSTPQSFHPRSLCLLQSHTLRVLADVNWMGKWIKSFIFKSARSTSWQGQHSVFWLWRKHL